MIPPQEHLTPDEMIRLLEPGEGPDITEERRSHSESCDVCKKVLAMYKDEDQRLGRLVGATREAPGPECPAATEWASLAAGLLEAAERDRLLDHACTCDGCGAVFSVMMEDFSKELTEAEAREIEGLRTATPEWQRDFARTLVPKPRKRIREMVVQWLPQAAAVLLTAGAAWWGYLSFWGARPPAQLLAQAYTQQRPFEFRIPGADHARIRVDRSGGSSFQKPAALNQAVASIAGALEKDPDNAEWLALRARAEMLSRDPEAAIATLTRAMEQKPDDPDLLAALGMAYALRGESPNRAVDYVQAIEYLGRSLKIKPNAPEAIFNLALVHERIPDYENASRQWQRYLQLDKTGPWADEARKHLAEIEQKKKARSDALGKITDDPADFLRRVEASEEVEAESYLEFAVAEWLPKRWESEACQRALEALAARLETRHGDRWLLDVLAAPPGERTVRGLVALAAAFKANQVEDAERALANVSQAQPNVEPPAALRVEAEYIHAVHRARRLSKCVERASAAEQKAADGGYFWIAAQVGIDLGNCRSGQGDYGGAYEDLERALQRARKAGYRILELRADGILAATRTSAGNLVVIWDQGQASLKKFWAGAYAGVRAQQVYYNLQRASEISDWPYAAQAFGRASVESIAGSRYRLLEAFGRTVVAGYAKRTGSLEEAAQEFDRAERLFEDLGTSKVTQEHRMTAQIDIAKADTEIGQAKAAFDRLSGLGKQVLSIDSTPVKLRFHGALGEALSRLGRSDEAEAAYLSARQLSEVHLASMKAIDQRADVMRIAPAAYLSLVEEHWNRHDFVRALQAWEWYRNGEQPGSHEVSNLHTSGLHRETFVAYAYLPRGLVVWVFDDRGIHGEALNVEEKQLKAAAYRFLRLCADRASNEAALQHEAWRLYDWLVRPIAHRLEAGRTIVVMPDGVISAIPLQAILDPESRYLGERFPVVSASSLADYQRRAKARSVYPDSRALVVANPALGQDVVGSYPPLPQTIIEGRHVAGRFRGSILLTGPEATLAAVDEARPKTEILHFAGHGFSNADNGGLLLAPAGTESQGTEVLEGKRLAGQDWTMCRLAVLSACSGGTGEARGPMNPESLVRRLLWAGVSRVVASRWNVDSENGVVLMDAFYSALLSGLDVPAALRQSARRVREQKATSHPYYWAGFQAFGSS